MNGFVAAVIAAILSLFGIHQPPTHVANTRPSAQVASAAASVEDWSDKTPGAAGAALGNEDPNIAATNPAPSPQATITKQPARLNDVSLRQNDFVGLGSGGYITQPVIERSVQSAPFTTGRVLGASTDSVTVAKLADLQDQINALARAPQAIFVPSFSGPAATTPVSTATFASSQNIDQLTNVTLNNA